MKTFVQFMEAKRSFTTALELAEEFLKGRDRVWLTVRQNNWLRDLIKAKGVRGSFPHKSSCYIGPYYLHGSLNNGTCILEKPEIKPDPTPKPITRSGSSIKFSDKDKFYDCMRDFIIDYLLLDKDFVMDHYSNTYYPNSPEAFEKMVKIVIDKGYPAEISE